MEQVSLEEVIRIVGGHSWYQKRLLIFMFATWFNYSLYIEGMAFILLSFTEHMSKDDEEFASAVIETSFFLGIGIGAGAISWVSNNYGRKLALVISQIIMILALMSSLFTSDYIFYSFS
jgi:MFS family permease